MRKNASTFEGIFSKIRPLKRPHFTTPHSTILYQSQIAIIYFFAIFPKIIFQVLQQARILGIWLDPLPLKDNAGIRCANALRINWNDVLPAEQCSYVIGNPPFYGARMQSKEQKADLMAVFGDARNSGNVDYVAGWFLKAADYIGDAPVRCAFVATNSICQGEQVANVWHPLHQRGIHIDFAHTTFRWRNEALEQAHVFVIIAGFSKQDDAKALYRYAKPDDTAPSTEEPERINAYLADAPDVFVWTRNKPMSLLQNLINTIAIDFGVLYSV